MEEFDAAAGGERRPVISGSRDEGPESAPKHELLILHTAEAQEWAAYLQQILRSSKKFHHSPVLLYAVGPADRLHGYNFESFRGCACIVLLLTGVFLDYLNDGGLQGALQSLLRPPHRVVALLCGVSEEDVSAARLRDWPSWRKLYAEDEPAVYVSTILDSISDSRRAQAEQQSDAAAAAAAASHATAAPSAEHPAEGEAKEVAPEKRNHGVPGDEEAAGEGGARPAQLACLTVQPSRVLCGARETLYIIFQHRLDHQWSPEVEFSSDKAVMRAPCAVANEYTLSVTAPDMPAGAASLTLHAGQSRVSLKPVVYYTSMGEISSFVENAADPVNFICQAFNLTSNTTESLDNMLTASLKSRLPATGFQLFGVRQIEEDNTSTCQRSEEFPTLLHFAARYGLKKLTTALLRCPGALQAYSVRNRHGYYPNTLAEKSGFTDLRQFMDEFAETADMLKSHIEDTIKTEDGAGVYEYMEKNSEDALMKYSVCSEDIYESMVGIDPQCAEDLYEVMIAVDENPEEAMLRTFFQVKLHAAEDGEDSKYDGEAAEGRDSHTEPTEDEEAAEEDPYNFSPEDIYDTVDSDRTYNPAILNRPPAPIPRPEAEPEPERPFTYISRVFSESGSPESQKKDEGYPAARPVAEAPASTYDPYAGMKTPGQRQLVSLQERVKVGEITVDEAVQEFKAWQFDHERRANSIRYQQENLKKLRDSITRRHKEREKTGKDLEYEISAPLQRNLYWSSNVSLECAVYEPTLRATAAPPPAAQSIQRGSWKTGSTSSTSSSESNRLSTHSTFSYSSGTEPDFEDMSENPPTPPRPPRPSDAAPHFLPPRVPPRIPERLPEVSNERYISCPMRALPQRPPTRHADSPPPLPRRLR